MSTPHTHTTVVLGGTGTTGRRVVDRLRPLTREVRVGSRQGSPRFAWEEQDTWDPILRDAAAVYVCYHPDLAVPGAAATVRALGERAVVAGVDRLVLLSGRGEVEAQEAEQALQELPIAVTVVRCSFFMQNFSEGAFADELSSGTLRLPVTDVGEPFVDADDIADVAVAALTDARHAGQVYELTGPRVLSFAEAVAVIATATGRPLELEAVSLGEHRRGLLSAGVGIEVADLLGYLFGEVLDGRNARLGDGVRRALGRPPRDFDSFARRAAAAGSWSNPLAAEAST